MRIAEPGMTKALSDFTAKLGESFGRESVPGDSDLRRIADELVRLCHELDVDTLGLPQALPGQEVLHELAVSPAGGPSAYLVSDGAGVSSPPHEHGTWAVIVGLRGVETNTRFERVAANSRQVRAIETVQVGAGQVLILSSTDIHVTDVSGERATYHVHLYGSALAVLPPFASRCFEAVEAG